MGAIAQGTGAEGLTKVFVLMHRDDVASTRCVAPFGVWRVGG